MRPMLGRKPRADPVRSSPPNAAVVEARDLTKTYATGRLRVPALRSVSLRIDRG